LNKKFSLLKTWKLSPPPPYFHSREKALKYILYYYDRNLINFEFIIGVKYPKIHCKKSRKKWNNLKLGDKFLHFSSLGIGRSIFSISPLGTILALTLLLSYKPYILPCWCLHDIHLWIYGSVASILFCNLHPSIYM